MKFFHLFVGKELIYSAQVFAYLSMTKLVDFANQTVKEIAVSNSLSESVVSSGTLGGISAKWLMIGKSK